MEFISIGSKCITAMNLKQTGFRNAAYPFDWLFCSLSMVQHCIATNFVYFLDRKYIVPVSESTCDHAFYKSFLHSKTDETISVFNHHNLCSAKDYNAYSRRCQRFVQRFYDKAKQVCLVYTIQRDHTTQSWPEDCSDPEWSDVCAFVKFLQNQNANNVMVLTFVLQRVKGQEVPQRKRFYNTPIHQAHIVYYNQYDNLSDVRAILEHVMKEKNDEYL